MKAVSEKFFLFVSFCFVFDYTTYIYIDRRLRELNLKPPIYKGETYVTKLNNRELSLESWNWINFLHINTTSAKLRMFSYSVIPLIKGYI